VDSTISDRAADIRNAALAPRGGHRGTFICASSLLTTNTLSVTVAAYWEEVEKATKPAIVLGADAVRERRN
jgi:hypothetical protein